LVLQLQPPGGTEIRFSLDVEFGKHIEKKGDAEKIATDVKAQINAGTFVRAKDRRKQAIATVPESAVTLDALAKKFIENYASVHGKKTWKNDEHMLAQLRAFQIDSVRLVTSWWRRSRRTTLRRSTLPYAPRVVRPRRSTSTSRCSRRRFGGAKKGCLARSPISEDSSLERTKIAQRTRRLVADVLDDKGQIKEPGEERRLLTATAKNPGMQRLIIAALETGSGRCEAHTLP